MLLFVLDLCQASGVFIDEETGHLRVKKADQFLCVAPRLQEFCVGDVLVNHANMYCFVLLDLFFLFFGPVIALLHCLAVCWPESQRLNLWKSTKSLQFQKRSLWFGNLEKYNFP